MAGVSGEGVRAAFRVNLIIFFSPSAGKYRGKTETFFNVAPWATPRVVLFVKNVTDVHR